MKLLYYSLLPFIILVFMVVISCVLGYFVVLSIGDIVPLRKVISKSTQFLLVLSIFPLATWLKMPWSEMGFAPAKQFFRQMGLGLFLGVLSLLPILLVLYSIDVHIMDTTRVWTLATVIKKVCISLLLALIISLVEEPLFRGILLAFFKRKMPVTLAVIFSSFYYASLHFLKSKSDVPYEQLSMGSSFELVAEAFSNWINPAVLSALIALWLVGIFLAVIRVEFKNSLGICIGCHTSWVWQIKISKDFLDINQNSEYLFLVSQYDGVVGPLVSGWMLLLITFYFGWKKYG